MLPADDRTVQLDLLLRFFTPDGIFLVYQEENDGLGRHHVLLDLTVELLLPVRVEQVEHLLLAEDLPLLVENLKVLLFQSFVDFGDLQ